MAESAVSSVVEKLAGVLTEEALLLYGVRDQVESLQSELRRMQCFLQDADAKRRKGDERVKNWVREMIDVAYRAEDVIDTFMLQVDQERRRRQKGFLACIKRYTLILAYQMKSRHKVGVEIESIKTKIREISDSRVTYGIANLGETGGDDPGDERVEARRRASPYLDNREDTIIGFHLYSEKVVKLLLDSDTKRRCIIAIVGMGGLGKTTLAEKVFKSPEIAANFPKCVWVSVSQDFKLRDLFKSIARKAMGSTTDELGKMEEEELKEMLCNFLKENKYLIVIDDIWTKDVWERVRAVLPDVMNGSRVLLTTRFEDVARSADPVIPPFMLPLLSDDESWELFTKKAFPTGCFPRELEPSGRRMMERCGGLPLALVVIGGLLSTRVPIPLVWLQVEETMDWESTQDGKQCINILALSYNNLPNHYIRSCFLYIGIFPEDYEIHAFKLAKLWTAEGLVQQRHRETMEDTARGYLDELARRSMIQVLKYKYDGSVSIFRIHDLFRDMCISVANQDGFFSIVSRNISDNTSLDDSVSRSRLLALYNVASENVHSYLHRKIRSLFVDYCLRNIGGVRILDGLKLLRVLELMELDVERFPKEIEVMTHLRYLDMTIPDLVKEIPSSIGKFRYLQTLDLRYVNYMKLPKELGELPSLRHLYLSVYSTNAKVPCPPFELPNSRHPSSRHLYESAYCTNVKVHCPPFTTSTKLQTLKNIFYEQCWMEESLPRLTNLRRLSINALKCEVDAKVLCDSFGKSNHLSSLGLLASVGVPAEAIITALTNKHHIQKMTFVGPWVPRQILPEAYKYPSNLAKLTLVSSDLDEDPFPVLEKLPNLMVLELSYDAYSGSTMVCTRGGFPRLQVLKLSVLNSLQDLFFEAGALPNLAKLVIELCYKLIVLPEGLQHVTSLKELEVSHPSQEFRDNLRENFGKDWYKIQHILYIKIEESW